MDKLEQYLDQVCRSIGGPRAMRQHVRQELREHLRDAVAQHQAAGLPEDEALARALEEFGKPEEVRSELEATHGHRMMAVVIDKAMQWKEMTMRAKWLWTTWAYLGSGGDDRPGGAVHHLPGDDHHAQVSQADARWHDRLRDHRGARGDVDARVPERP